MDKLSENFGLYETVSTSRKALHLLLEAPQMLNASIKTDLLQGLHINHNKVKVNLCWNASFILFIYW